MSKTKTPRRTRKSAATKSLIAQMAEHYPDTEGEDLPEPIDGASYAKQAKTDEKFIAKRKAKQTAQYAGAPIVATQVYCRQMGEFKFDATTWIIVNETAGTYSTANTYKGVLPASYRADAYTYELNDAAKKRLVRKTSEMVEIERPEWPTWITAAGKAAKSANRRSGKS